MHYANHNRLECNLARARARKTVLLHQGCWSWGDLCFVLHNNELYKHSEWIEVPCHSSKNRRDQMLDLLPALVLRALDWELFKGPSLLKFLKENNNFIIVGLKHLVLSLFFSLKLLFYNEIFNNMFSWEYYHWVILEETIDRHFQRTRIFLKNNLFSVY